MSVRMRLGERLMAAGLITRHQLDKGLEKHGSTGQKLGKTLVDLGYLHPDQLMKALCDDAAIPYAPVGEVTPSPDALAAIPEPIARRLASVPLRFENGRLVVAMTDPFDMDAVSSLERAARKPIKEMSAPRAEIAALLRRAYDRIGYLAPNVTGDGASTDHLEGFIPTSAPPPRTADVPVEESVTAAKLVEEMIRRGMSLGATDIHLEPLEEITKVRYRLDGLLHDGGTYPRAMQAALSSRIKILAGLDIAETRLPQDGRLRMKTDNRSIDLRVSTFPTLHGEDIVLRILDRSRTALNLERLGIDPEDLAILRAAFVRPHGLIPVTGPTGSGKTTTLYSAIVELNNRERCILTLEDPVEYELPQIRQSQINVRAGLTFASGLRSMLRHDPDTILVGEMRDAETVQIGLTAALTGHLVLTTLHTNTAAGAIPRLLDMGAEAFVLTSSVLLVISQRLVRVLCKECRVVTEVGYPVRERFRLGDAPVYSAKGCNVCRGSGYKGRIGIFEFLPMTSALVAAVYERRPAEEIQRISGRPTLFEDGLKKVRAGVTTLDELLRVTSI